MNRLSAISLAAAVVALTPVTAQASPPGEEAPWTLSAAFDTRWVWDGSYDLLADNDVLTAVELALGRRVTGGLTAALAWRGGTASERHLFQSYRMDLFHQEAVLALTWEQPVVGEWFRPLLRADAGLIIGRLGLGLSSSDEDVSDWAFAGRAHLGAGFRLLPFSDVRVPKRSDDEAAEARPGYSFGIEVTFGYTYASPLHFDDLARPEPDEEPEVPPIGIRPLDVGAFDLSGPELRVGALMRF